MARINGKSHSLQAPRVVREVNGNDRGCRRADRRGRRRAESCQRPAHPKLQYSAGGRASRLPLLRRLLPGRMMDAGIRKDLRLDAPTASLVRALALAKSSIQNRTIVAESESPYDGSGEHDAI